jgi:predicted lipoprotein with Yx(FWY)xxD motif
MNKIRYFSIFKCVSVTILVFLTACGGLPILGNQGVSDVTPSAAVPVTGQIPAVTVNDQESDGTTVTVEAVFSQGPGWMVIHNQVNGTVGDAIGETPLNDGENTNVVVTIDPAKATPILYAMLHADAGVVGTYEFPGPDVPIMVGGDMLSPAFKATLTTGGMNMETPAGGSAGQSVKVADQVLSGSAVMVDEVNSSGPGWIVIYTTDSYGQPVEAIGHAAVQDGVNQNVMVEVDPVKATGTLYAQLQADKGMVGTYEYPGADEPVMVGVQMIAGAFKILDAQASGGGGGAATPAVLKPSITVADQQIQDGTVTIPQVVSNGNWWLVIHRQSSDGSMGEYIGQTLLKNGINTDVVVKINVTKASPVLYAMLHEDNAPFGILEFPGTDVPVEENGAMIAPSFNVTGLSQDITITIHKVSDTVSFLTDGDGNSLYISLQDDTGKSNCTGACLTLWKPLIAKSRVVAGPGLVQANLGIITLADGSHQVTFLGSPLYTYTKDTHPGDTTGQGLNGEWFLVTP